MTASRVLGCVLVLALAASVSGCGKIPGFKKPPPPQPGANPPPNLPAPVPLTLTVQSSATVNPGETGRPSPIVVRVYQLKRDVAFRAAPYDKLFDDDKGTLGDDLVERMAVTLRPSDQSPMSLMVRADVRFIGVAAFYRQYDSIQWKILIPTPLKGEGILLVDKASVSFTAK